MTGNDAETRGLHERPSVVCAGLVVADLFVPPLTALPASGEIVTISDPLSDVGGCAANTATALVRPGIPTTLVARVGDDDRGAWVSDQLRRRGVDVAAAGRHVTPSPKDT